MVIFYRWWFLNVLYFRPYLGKWSNLTIWYFFKWVVQPPTSYHLQCFHPLGFMAPWAGEECFSLCPLGLQHFLGVECHFVVSFGGRVFFFFRMDLGWVQPLNDVAPNVSQAVTTHGRFLSIFWGLKYTWCFFFKALTTSRGVSYYKPPKPQDGLDTNPNPQCFVQSCTPEDLHFAWDSVFKVCFRVLLVLPPWFVSRLMNILTGVTLVGFDCWVKLLEGTWMHTINMYALLCSVCQNMLTGV